MYQSLRLLTRSYNILCPVAKNHIILMEELKRQKQKLIIQELKLEIHKVKESIEKLNSSK